MATDKPEVYACVWNNLQAMPEHFCSSSHFKVLSKLQTYLNGRHCKRVIVYRNMLFYNVFMLPISASHALVSVFNDILACRYDILYSGSSFTTGPIQTRHSMN